MPLVWMGVSVESETYLFRIKDLTMVPPQVRFLSLEPLLGPLPVLPLKNIDWVIVGGESGPQARPVEHQWITQIRDQCLQNSVPFLFKQWGGVRKERTGRLLDGRT
jgi:protein gp37